MKVHKTISIDIDIVRQSKKLPGGENFSRLLETLLAKELLAEQNRKGGRSDSYQESVQPRVVDS